MSRPTSPPRLERRRDRVAVVVQRVRVVSELLGETEVLLGLHDAQGLGRGEVGGDGGAWASAAPSPSVTTVTCKTCTAKRRRRYWRRDFASESRGDFPVARTSSAQLSALLMASDYRHLLWHPCGRSHPPQLQASTCVTRQLRVGVRRAAGSVTYRSARLGGHSRVCVVSAAIRGSTG